MKIFVLIKQVPDTETKIRLMPDQNGIEISDIKWILNPYDEFAIEEALKTREGLKEGSVTALTVGPDRSTDALRTCLAMGADEAIQVKGDDTVDTYLVSRALTEVIKRENAQFVFAGRQAIDDDQAAVFGYVGELLGWPSVGMVVKVDLSSDRKSVRIQREIEGGIKNVIEMPVPCLMAVNKGINSPRYASLPGIMKAKKKEIKRVTFADLGLANESPRVQDGSYRLPPERKAGKRLDGEPATQVRELVKLLREEAKVI